jgi:hypothetical protein
LTALATEMRASAAHEIDQGLLIVDLGLEVGRLPLGEIGLGGEPFLLELEVAVEVGLLQIEVFQAPPRLIRVSEAAHPAPLEDIHVLDGRIPVAGVQEAEELHARLHAFATL